MLSIDDLLMNRLFSESPCYYIIVPLPKSTKKSKSSKPPKLPESRVPTMDGTLFHAQSDSWRSLNYDFPIIKRNPLIFIVFMLICIFMLIFCFSWITIENLLKDFGEFQKPAASLPERPSLSTNLSSKSPLVLTSKDHRNLWHFYLCSATEPDPSLTRTWTDVSGTFRVEAQFLELQNDLVLLHKINGVKITVPLQRFSQTDQDYIRNITSTSSVDGSKDLSYTTNGFDWYEFFVKAGISENDAKIYARHFVLKKMDSTMMAELDSRLLKDLGVHADGDIIRIQRAIARTIDRTTTPLSQRPTNLTVSDELLKDFSQTSIKAKSSMKIKEERDRQKAMELSHEAKAIRDRYASPTSTLMTTRDRSVDPSKLSSSDVAGVPSMDIPIDFDRSPTTLGPISSQYNVSSFSEGWMNEIRPSASTNKTPPRDMPTMVPDSTGSYYGSNIAPGSPSRLTPSSQYPKVFQPTTMVEQRPMKVDGSFQSRWQSSVDSSFPAPPPIAFDPSVMTPKDPSRVVFPASTNDPLEGHPMFPTIRPAPMNVTSFPREKTGQSSPFGPSFVSAPPPPDVASFMRVASVSSSQPLIPEPSPYPSTGPPAMGDQTRKWSHFSFHFASSFIFMRCSFETSLPLEFQTSTDRYSIFRTVNPHSPSIFDSSLNRSPQQPSFASTPTQTSTGPWFSQSADTRLLKNPTKLSSASSSSTSSGQRPREPPSSSSTPRQAKEVNVKRN
jgi:hypothetical protein